MESFFPDLVGVVNVNVSHRFWNDPLLPLLCFGAANCSFSLPPLVNPVSVSDRSWKLDLRSLPCPLGAPSNDSFCLSFLEGDEEVTASTRLAQLPPLSFLGGGARASFLPEPVRLSHKSWKELLRSLLSLLGGAREVSVLPPLIASHRFAQDPLLSFFALAGGVRQIFGVSCFGFDGLVGEGLGCALGCGLGSGLLAGLDVSEDGNISCQEERLCVPGLGPSVELSSCPDLAGNTIDVRP